MEFTDFLTELFNRAGEEASRRNHGYIGVEHLFLALLRDEQSIVVRILQKSGVDCVQIKEEIDSIIARGGKLPEDRVNLTHSARRVVDLAFTEGRRQNLPRIEGEHILLAILAEDKSLPAWILKQLNVSYQTVTDILQKLQSPQTTD